ncbi:hypothetical protein [Bradyrhizobium sp. 132]|uniref:hypothetical protein n=1 Tax=Bradyrhizobium sp. 132 TaxID=2782610 RepID=UPI001FFA006D|nr:hypothetical protein [Bradyrhizobium sp. 132]
MEPIYNDPNYWMRWHAEQQELQRARQETDVEPADQAGFEQQLDELQLRSPEESSGGSSPDTPAPQSHENIQRTDVGGSMRMPPRSNLRNNSFSSARHSVDVPHAHLGSAANNYRSDLREGPFSSMRYAAPSEEQPTARTKDNKPRGLFSRVKSGLSKVFGGSHREKWSGGPAFDVVYSELRMDFAKRSRPSEADLELIEEFKTAFSANRNAKTIDNYVRTLRMFSEFLQPKGVTLNDLLGNAELLTACKDEFRKVASANNRNRVGSALDALQNFQAGHIRRSLGGRRAQPLHPQDERLIEEFKTALGSANRNAKTIDNYVRALRMFSEFLQPQGVTLNDLLGNTELLTAYKDEFKKVASANSRNHVGPALDALQNFQAGNPISAPAWVGTRAQPMPPPGRDAPPGQADDPPVRGKRQKLQSCSRWYQRPRDWNGPP